MKKATILQVAYLVDDIRTSVDHWVRTTGAGPFFVGNQNSIEGAVYRGEPSRVEFTYAMGYCGDLQIELIQQHNDAPSVYKEFADRHGTGYHHINPLVPDYDQALADYAALGVDVAFSGVVPGIGRMCYLDGTALFGGFIELIEDSPALRAAHEMFRSASANWDGLDPIRSFAPPG